MHSSQIFSNIFPFSVPCRVHGLCIAGAQQCPLQWKHYEVVTSTIALNNSTKTPSLQIKNKWFQTEPNPVYALRFPGIQFSSQHLIARGPLQDSQPTVNATLSFFQYRRKKRSTFLRLVNGDDCQPSEAFNHFHTAGQTANDCLDNLVAMYTEKIRSRFEQIKQSLCFAGKVLPHLPPVHEVRQTFTEHAAVLLETCTTKTLYFTTQDLDSISNVDDANDAGSAATSVKYCSNCSQSN